MHLVRVAAHHPQPTIDLAAEGLVGFRWWTLDELAATDERVPDLVAQLRTLLA